jgi:hypothetical protein
MVFGFAPLLSRRQPGDHAALVARRMVDIPTA